jgi:cell shape-determining protein MreC
MFGKILEYEYKIKALEEENTRLKQEVDSAEEHWKKRIQG